MDSPPGLENTRLGPDPQDGRRRKPLFTWVSGLLWGIILLILLLGIRPRWLFGYPSAIRMKKEAGLMSMSFAAGIDQFYAEYSRLPMPNGQKPGKADLDSDTSFPAGLVRVLIGKEHNEAGKQNPSDIDFIEGIKAAASNVKTGLFSKRLPWSNGLIYEHDEHALVDSWGNFYRVRLDGDGNQQVANPDPREAAAGRPTLPRRVIVWSPGKDGKEETWEDNLRSWEE